MAYFMLPDKSKPSKVANKDSTRPILTCGNVTQDRDGAWFLEVTDSYCLARIPLSVHDTDEDGGLTPGMVSREALQAIEKTGAGAFSVDDAGLVSVRDRKTGRILATMPASPSRDAVFPNCRQLIPDVPTGSLVVKLDPALLAAVEAAQGRQRHGGVELILNLERAHDGVYLRAVHVSVNGQDGNVVMPIRTQPRVAAGATAAA